WKSDALYAGAEALDGIGKHKEAEQMARDRMERYPTGAHEKVDLATLFWRNRRYDEAARVLASRRYPIAPLEWSDPVARRFYEVFADRPNEEIRAAYEPIQRLNLNPWSLSEFARVFAGHGRFDVAFDLLSSLTERLGMGRLDPWLDVIRYL